MQHPSKRRRAALAVLAAGSLTLLAACGGDTQPAAGADATSDSSAASGTDNKTIVFSPLGLQIPAMKQLSEGVQGYGESKGYDVIVQDPKLDPQKQVTDLQTRHRVRQGRRRVVDRHRPAGDGRARADRARQGRPDHPQRHSRGLRPRRPGAGRLVLDHRLRGRGPGRRRGARQLHQRAATTAPAKVLFGESAPGTAGKEEFETAVKDALAETAPDAEIVSTFTVSDRAAAQTDVGSALQGNPDLNAVFGQNDEGALGAVGAFKAAGKDVPCITEGGGNEETLAAVESGDIYAVVALQFADDMAQSFDALTAMIDDPTATGVQLTVPQEVVKADG